MNARRGIIMSVERATASEPVINQSSVELSLKTMVYFKYLNTMQVTYLRVFYFDISTLFKT